MGGLCTGLRELLETVETPSLGHVEREDWAPGSPKHRPTSSEVLRAVGASRSAVSSPVRQCQTLVKDVASSKTSGNVVVHTSKIRRALLRFNLLSRADR